MTNLGTMLRHVLSPTHGAQIVDAVVGRAPILVVDNATARERAVHGFPNASGAGNPLVGFCHLDPNARLAALVDKSSLGTNFKMVCWRLPSLEFRRWGKMDALLPLVPRLVPIFPTIRGAKANSVLVANVPWLRHSGRKETILRKQLPGARSGAKSSGRRPVIFDVKRSPAYLTTKCNHTGTIALAHGGSSAIAELRGQVPLFGGK